MCFILKFFLLTTIMFLALGHQAHSPTAQTHGPAKTGRNEVTYIDIDEPNDDAISVGKRMLKNQMIDKALVHLNAALEEDPTNYEAYFLRATANLLLSASQTDSFIPQTESNNVLQDLDTSIGINPRFIAALALRGFVYIKQGKLTKATKDFKEIERLEPVNVKDLAYLHTLESVAAELEHSKKLYSSPNNNTICYLLIKAFVKRLDPSNQNVLSFVQKLQESSDAQILNYPEIIKAIAQYLVKSKKFTKEIEFLALIAIDRMAPKMGRAMTLILEQDYHKAMSTAMQAFDECYDLVHNQEVLAVLKQVQSVLTDIGDALDDIIELYREGDYKGAIMLLLEETMLSISRFQPEAGNYLQKVVRQMEPDLDDAIALCLDENDYQRAFYLFAWALVEKITHSNQRSRQLESIIETRAVAFHRSIIIDNKSVEWGIIYKFSKTFVESSFNLSQPAVLHYLRTIQLLTVQIEQAKVLYNKQDYRGAIDVLSKAIDKQLDVSNEEAALYIQFMELLVAEFEFSIILFGKPDYLEDINLLCMALIRRLYHFNQEASRNLQTIEKLSKTIEDAEALYSRRNYQEAIRLLSSGINISRWDPDLLERRAECYGAVGDLPNALQNIKLSANLLNPGDSALEFLKISVLFYRIGDAGKSLRLIKECLKLDPDNKQYHLFYKNVKKLDQLLMNTNKLLYDEKWDDCVSQANEILQMEPNHFKFVLTALSHKCHCLTKGGYGSHAQMTCNKVLEMDPDNVNALCDKAENFIANKHYQAAIALFRHTLDIDDTNRRAKEGIQLTKKLLKFSEKRDYYDILGIERHATKKQIEKAYTKLSIQWNPDKFDTKEQKKVAETKFMDIAAAKEVLTYQIMNDWYFEDMDMDELGDE